MPRKQLILRKNHCGYSDQYGSQTVSSRYIGIEKPLTNSPQKLSLACTNLSNRSSGERHGFHSCGGTCRFHRDQSCCALTPLGRHASIAMANVNAAQKYCNCPILANGNHETTKRNTDDQISNDEVKINQVDNLNLCEKSTSTIHAVVYSVIHSTTKAGNVH